MPMFYFDVLEIDGSTTRATEGVEFESLETAMLSATQTICRMVLPDAETSESLSITISVRLQNGDILGKCGIDFDYIDLRGHSLIAPLLRPEGE